ncbi:hypothetical protein CPT_Pollock7 [Escherichia phage Pollock]|uniref:Uncharacterized protein n=1 Tax=Escherichia phage Pollock TaxID=1540097 RepID=A0A0A0YQT6_9CAUD|nr:hypothetical protein ACQ44_gp07 [Escherichia phage Pollock]AIX12366.1 hypothetical protein CPT_Pollock7 [Escherichia phage Pollock]
MKILAVFLLFLLLLSNVLLEVLDKDTVQYQQQMECIKKKISHGIPRSSIQLTDSSCKVIK